MSLATMDDLAATSLAATLLPVVRRALQRRDLDEARAQFLRLPALDARHAQWLEDVLRDGYTAGLLDVSAVLSFLESLPNWHWTLDGCCVLHGVNTSLESSSAHVVHVPTLPLAYFLHKLMNHLDGSVKVRAEAYWYEWVSPTMRAIVTGQPLRIESLPRRETFYAPANNFAFDFDRRNVFTWRAPWTPDDRKDQWRLIPASVRRDRFLLQSVQHDEYLYAADYAKFRRDDRGNLRSRVFAWRKKDDPVGESGHWQLVPVDPQHRDVFALYNPYQKEYLYSPSDVYDRERRYVFTAAHAASDAAWEQERRWRIAPVAFPPMEQGIEAFFRKRYPEAVALLSQALDEMPDHTEHAKCFVYRMAANARMGKHELLQGDFTSIEVLGGDKAAIFHGLHHLWAESAAVLQLQAAAEGSDATTPSAAAVLVSVDHHLQRGDQLFVLKEYEGALGAYEQAASTHAKTRDRTLQTKRASARLACAKCQFAMHHTESAMQILENLLQAEHDGSGDDDGGACSSAAALPVEFEARVLLWMGRCQRQQRAYDEALHSLERALDKLAATSDNSHLWVRQYILIEMQVVGIHRRELLDGLLARSEQVAALLPTPEDHPRAAERTVQQMVDLFHCPLSLEPMQDPVMTPNGDTYERDMIERHLEVNGLFDPMTRAPLTKAQLYPNRALKMLMETLLSEHKLGLLLASCSE